jgi:2-hydroxy-3-keto-5-methylthiopentenyl-1-phosphate phosphatase
MVRTEFDLQSLRSKVLVTDFDGTMTGVDFYDAILEWLGPERSPATWQALLDDRATLVEGLQSVFSAGPRHEVELRELLPRTRLDERIPDELARLHAAGWDVVVLSAGCEWYIRELLADVQTPVTVIANPGDVVPGQGLQMRWTDASRPWFDPHFGVNKAWFIQQLVASNRDVAFAGDGRPDVHAARLVDEHRRFACGWLADVLSAEGLRFRGFSRWSDISRAVLPLQRSE